MKEEFDALFAEHQKLLGELQAMRNVKRQWAALTDAEITQAITDEFGGVLVSSVDIARAIEAKLKEKNT